MVFNTIAARLVRLHLRIDMKKTHDFLLQQQHAKETTYPMEM